MSGEVKPTTEIARLCRADVRDGYTIGVSGARSRQLAWHLLSAASHIGALQEHADAMCDLLEHYVKETPLGHQPHMIAQKATDAVSAYREFKGHE